MSKNQSSGFAILFFVFYFVLFATWITTLAFHFIGYDKQNSFVIAEYLLSGRYISIDKLTPDWTIGLVNILVKTNLIILGGVVGTIFLIYNILPKMKHMAVWALGLSFFAAYIPAVLTIQKLLFSSTKPFENYITSSEFALLLLLYPLNYAVFFYFYYLVDEYILKVMRS
jgi:hypothetical protein